MPIVSSTNPQLWQAVLPSRLRSLLQDVDEQSPEFTEEALVKLIVDAAKSVSGDLSLQSTWEINTVETFISPDPLSPESESFTSLVLLRAQLMLAVGEWRKAVKKSIQITFGPRIDVNTASQASAFKAYVDQLTKQYQQQLTSYKLNIVGKNVFAVMSGSPVGPDYAPAGQAAPFGGQFSH